ncbi:MAG: hypothetical protein GXP54_12310 [Deltaproteobacteria bacterium]|nr:hypothetical protein [Deltaproteobacteria bacterium]
MARKRTDRKKVDGETKGACPYCGGEVDFMWTCPCGFRMCQGCMNDNLWGLTCNNITWTCPDCGRDRSY